MIDISKPIYAKIYDYDEAYCESDCDDTCGSYIIREVEELHFATKRCEAFIRYSVVLLVRHLSCYHRQKLKECQND